MLLPVRWLALALALMAMSFAIAACGGGDDNDDPTATPRAADDGANGQDGDDGGEDSGSSGSGSEGDFRAAARKFPESTYRAVYEISGPDVEGLGATQITFLKDGTDRLRIEVTAEAEGERFDLIVIEDAGESAFCFRGGGPLASLIEGAEDGACFTQDPTGGAGFSDITSEFEQFDDEDYEAMDVTTQQIAGEDAICATVTQGEETSNVCLSSNGALLLADTAGSGLRATEVSGDVDDGDFELPYEVREFPGLGE